jgi:imidazolonepropionase-like amidohydrolase
MSRVVATLCLALLALSPRGLAQDGEGLAPATILLRGRVHVGDGRVVDDGVVVVREKRVVAVGPWSEVGPTIPEGARVLTAPGAEVSPGLIDAMSTAGLTNVGSWADHESEVVPHLRVLDEVDLHAPVWRRLIARGVTTVCVTASPESVIGSRTAIVRTGGPLTSRVVQAEGAVKSTLGPEAWRRGARNQRPFGGAIDHMTRRPTTRMGGVWTFRDAFARARAQQLEGPGADVLREVLAGEVALRIQARTRGDIETALRLTAEAGIGSFVLEEASEVRYVLDLVKERDVALVFGPVFDRPRGWRAFTGEGNDPALSTAAMVHAAGLRFCLTAADREDEDDLRAQAMMAARYGLDAEAALVAVTGSPAEIMGLARTGVLAADKDADVVLWSGPPLEPTSRPLAVLIQGRLVHERAADPTPTGGAAAPPSTPPPPARPPQRF